MITKIEVCIPYGLEKRLGQAYNEAMKKADDWVLFLDHDLFICNPNWYEICLDVINKAGNNIGWISAFANRNAPASQKYKNAPEDENLVNHIKFAEKMYNLYGATFIDRTNDPIEFCGFFILTNKKAWETVGGFIETKFHVDGTYFGALKEKGFRFISIPGLYFYHLELKKNDLWNWAKWKPFGNGNTIL